MFRIIPRHSIGFGRRELGEVLRCLVSGKVVRGGSIPVFEERFARYIGVDHAVSVSSARSALLLILEALDLEEGDEVIVPAYSFFVVPEIVRLKGLVPVFAGVSPDTLTVSPAAIERCMSSRTKAIVVEHIYGLACDMASIGELARRRGATLIEDCAQACGSETGGRKAGSFGDVSYFSFGTGKNMTCPGGGMILTRDRRLAERLRTVRAQFRPYRKGEMLTLVASGLAAWFLMLRLPYALFMYPVLLMMSIRARRVVQFNEEHSVSAEQVRAGTHPMGNIQAAVGLRQLERLDGLNARRASNARVLNGLLSGAEGVRVFPGPPGCLHTYNCFAVRLKDAERVAFALLRKGVDTREDWMDTYGGPGETDERVLYLPNHPGLTDEDMHYVAGQLRAALHRGRGA